MQKKRPLSRFLSCEKKDFIVESRRGQTPNYFAICKKYCDDHNSYVKQTSTGFICSDRQLSKILDRCKENKLNRTDTIQRVKNFLYLLKYSKFSNSYHKDNDLLPDKHPCKKNSTYESYLFESRFEAEEIAKKIGLVGTHSTIISGKKVFVPGKHKQEIENLLRGDYE